MINTQNNLVGVASPFYINAVYNQAEWVYIDVDLYVWSGGIQNIVDEPISLNKYKISESDSNLVLDLAPYIRHQINPTINPLNCLSGNSDKKAFKYVIKYYNSEFEKVYETESQIYIASLGWRYNFQTNQQNPTIDPEVMANGITYDEFAFNNLESKEKYFYYSDKMIENNDSVWYTSYEFPIATTSDAGKYIGYGFNVNQNKIKCQPYNYGLVFLNKVGDWDMLPIFGKVTSKVSKTSTKYNKGIKDKFNYSTMNSKAVGLVNENFETEFNINTGHLTEVMSNYWETIIYSPIIYLVDYDLKMAYGVTIAETEVFRKNIWNDKNKITHSLTLVEDKSKKQIW